MSDETEKRWAFCYTRTLNAETADKKRKAMALWCGKVGLDFAAFSWDALSGQRGLAVTFRLMEKAEGDKVMVVDHLSDLARDLPGLVKQMAALLDKGVSIYALATNLWFASAIPEQKEPLVIKALAAAHVRYTSENRRKGIASAREAGAQIGRPTTFTLDAHRKTLENLTDRNAGELPTVRKLAETIKCGKTTAGRLLAEYEQEKAQEAEAAAVP